ncbi:TVP38/TMEM64 family protein [Hyphomonas oceanitis]|uniref:TVP38/TMEM64 family protein n=1 Tax=Hyphomonas oceanitis TaxID=81033 RepID=UPI0030021C0B
MSEMDKTASQPARRTLLLGGGLLVGVLVLFALGKLGIMPSEKALNAWMETVAGSPWGLPAIILVFCVAAFLGVPQFALIAAAVAVFGPWLGFAYAWIANMFSGSLAFWLGRLAGEQMFRRYAGATANRLSGFVGRNAFATSALIRNVPTGPAVMVNMAFGVSSAKYTNFALGMALGILPKIALIAFAGQSLFAAMKGNPGLAVLAAIIAAAIYAAIALYARTRMGPKGQSVPLIGDNPVDTGPKQDD